ncbi:hypothetical protein [Budvicia aquatica]|uniref:Uncharacterized protein n=1 Tax=Budvicia aquatica TaxID=82979 RepID=A0A2C6C3Y4_9GAMM|nr:hypothetical protein [Budvicia aquatica]PHI31060.1 hypothetical protein CRN84_17840 [Budvicia aquatica]VFS51277.1 Uncharacterised protein [Budvicia aquatica]
MHNVTVLEAITRIESIQHGIGALGEILQVIELDSISDEAVGNIGSMFVVLSQITLEALGKVDGGVSHDQARD